MKFSAYKVKNDHRQRYPSKTKGVWKVDEWAEIELFIKAKMKGWVDTQQGFIWSISQSDSNGTRKIIGLACKPNPQDRDRPCYIAKYRKDKNNEWRLYRTCLAKLTSKMPS